MDRLELIATAAFGLEAVVSNELKQLGYAEQTVQDGQVQFTGDGAAICRANLWLRSADRVLVKLATFPAEDFGALFDQTRALPWADWLPEDAAFPVQGKSVRSTLKSVRDCQALVKKAIVEKLKCTYGRQWFDETGAVYAVRIALLKDQATLTLDTSGAGLHKRGYRPRVGAAPLKETLAAALVHLSHWNHERPLIDPFCGTGTIPIEAALIGRNLAPGLARNFSAEGWHWLPSAAWDAARTEARDVVRAGPVHRLLGTDIDEKALEQARDHAARAGVADDVHFQRRAFAELTTQRKYGCLIGNPPYGERLGDREQAEALYRTMAAVLAPLDTWSNYVLTSHPHFERIFGRPATRRRKLYNGRIECTYYQYSGPRPPARRK